MIPKIVHYCWYGNEKPKTIKKYMSTWNVLNDYKVIEWNEKNCNLEINEFVKGAVRNSRWGYVSDYFRLKALAEYGGVYLDTDVWILKKFDDLLSNGAFVGYIFDSSIGTAVLGFEKNHPLLSVLISAYESAKWIDEFHVEIPLPSGKQVICKVNNDLFTSMFLDLYPEFLLNGKEQYIESIRLRILPKEEFELGYIFPGKGYCIHKCEGSWDNMKLSKKINATIKKVVSYVPGIHLDILIRTITYKKYMKKTPNYNRYLEDTK